MRNNYSAVDPTGMLPKLYNAERSIFVWGIFASKGSGHLRGYSAKRVGNER
jgi:hypothetical protein